MSTDVIVVGGGAAGLMAAVTAAESGKHVLLMEQNRVFGRKLRITGKGRCNVTNRCEPEKVIENTPGNGRFLYSAIHGFTPEDTMALMESLGVPLKTERGNRVFPVSDKADDIADALVRKMKRYHVEMIHTKVTGLLTEGTGIKGVHTKQGIYMAPKVIVACGGASYPGTGSDGNGYRLAEKVGHRITSVKPSLVPLEDNGTLCSRLQGLSLRNSAVSVRDETNGKIIYQDFGELLFTHFGLSGPTILSASAHMRGMAEYRYTVLIDLKPALDEQKLDARLLRDLEENKNRIFGNSLGKLLPKSLIPVIIEKTDIAPDTQCNSITKEERRRLCRVLKGLAIPIRGFRPIQEAIVTSGGVDTHEINPRNMESKLISGLHFAGEMIDVDAYTGGFNLQIAFSTAVAAAR